MRENAVFVAIRKSLSRFFARTWPFFCESTVAIRNLRGALTATIVLLDLATVSVKRERIRMRGKWKTWRLWMGWALRRKSKMEKRRH
jgi:hypothetical protein